MYLDTGYCEPGWKQYGSKCYLFRYGDGKRLKFDDAKEYCKTGEGGDLVSIHSKYEQNFVNVGDLFSGFILNRFINNVEKWPNILQRFCSVSCGVHNTRF